MLIEFSHFPTPTTRRVSFFMDAGEYRRAMELPAAHTLKPTIQESEHAAGSVRLTMPVATAMAYCEVLAQVGGDAAVAERMLRDQLAGMIAELRASRNGRQIA